MSMAVIIILPEGSATLSVAFLDVDFVAGNLGSAVLKHSGCVHEA